MLYNIIIKEFLTESGLAPGSFEFCECIEDEKLFRYFENIEMEYIEKCGFENIAYFTKVFKKETSILPSQVRKNL